MLVGVIGLGTIGIKLIEYLLEKGLWVIAYNYRNIDKKSGVFESNLDKKVKYEKIGLGTIDRIKNNVKFTADLEDLHDASIIIDASAERYSIKEALYSHLLKFKEQPVVACTTSSLDLKKLGNYYDPQFFVGMHFFNPPTKMKLIELAFLPETDFNTKQKIYKFLNILDDKKVIEVPPIQGYIVNRLLFLYMNAAFKMIEKYGLDCDTIDEAMKAGTNMPMGPCELSDYVGNDITLDILFEFYTTFREEEYLPSELLVRKVKLGELGRKVKKGFYNY